MKDNFRRIISLILNLAILNGLFLALLPVPLHCRQTLSVYLFVVGEISASGWELK